MPIIAIGSAVGRGVQRRMFIEQHGGKGDAQPFLQVAGEHDQIAGGEAVTLEGVVGVDRCRVKAKIGG
jgi:hypothetical protein